MLTLAACDGGNVALASHQGAGRFIVTNSGSESGMVFPYIRPEKRKRCWIVSRPGSVT